MWECGTCGAGLPRLCRCRKERDVEPLIRLHAYEPSTVTYQEYEELVDELHIKAMVDELTLGDKILARLLRAHFGRYVECYEIMTGKTHEIRKR